MVSLRAGGGVYIFYTQHRPVRAVEPELERRPDASGEVVSRFRKRLWIGLALMLSIVVVLWAVLHVPTRRALERAEAFQFRRMLVTQRGEEGADRFFYVTNRGKAQPLGALEERFENVREANIAFGFFDTDIEPSLGIGMIINPTEWFQSEEIQLRQVRNLGKPEFIEELRTQVHESPYHSLMININGFREKFPSALRKAAFLAHVLDIDTLLLVFDWPGDQGPALRGYRRAQQVARDSGRELAATIELMVREVEPERLWLLANSMGGKVVVNAFNLLFQEVDFADGARRESRGIRPPVQGGD